QMADALTKEQALRGMTIWAAKAAFEETEKGSLEPGKAADFILLDRNILTCRADSVLATQVKATYLNGKKVFGSAD
ncbi:MAG TPA: amidohydrolase family protein, partial [Ferruginibacter sp.]|nr:amidohydrolase family protein [Ferruginibacter sp.]